MRNGKPFVVDGYCGLGGWSEAFISEGWECVGIDIEKHDYGKGAYPGQLILQDMRTVKGEQFKDADLLVFSPPCTEYSYMSMPWKRGKQIASALRGHGDFPVGYKGSRTIAELNDLFNQCFRIQREISEACGHYVPMIIENVRGAQKWVGKARWNFGSYYLWGDVPALMPIPSNVTKVPGFRFDGNGGSFQTAATNRSDGVKGARFTGRDCGNEGTKGFTPNSEPLGKNTFARMYGSKSKARKQASAEIAKIPHSLAQWIAKTFKVSL